MSIWDTALLPNADEQMALQAVGEALLWPGSSSRWRTVFRWADQHPDSPIARTILRAVAHQTDGNRVKEALALGRDWQEINEPLWLTEAFAEADGGDVAENVRSRLEQRKIVKYRRSQQRKEPIG